MWRRLTGVRGLAGLRRALFAAALLALAASAVGILFSAARAERWGGWGAVALALLALRWWRLYATQRPSTALDICEAGAVALLGVALGADNAMPVVLAGLTFRAQYGTRRRVLGGAALYACAHVVATVLELQRFPDLSLAGALALVPFLLVVPTSAAELARGIVAIEAGARRERALARAVASFLVATGPEALAARTQDAIEQALGTRLSGWAVVLDAARVPAARERLAAGGAAVYERGAVLAAHREPLRSAEGRWIDTLADQLALAVAAHATRAARASERIGALVERTGGVVLVVEPDLTVVWATPGTAALLGKEPAELAGSSVLELLHRADRERGSEALAGAVGGDPHAPERVTLRLRGDGGATRWVELSVADLREDEAVGAFAVQLRDISARVALEQDVRRRDDHDALTGLPNRERFERLVAEELRAGNERLAVALVDLDAFSAINESLGHATGDEVLAEVARRLAYAAAGRGTVARLASDSFAILLLDVESGRSGCEAVEQVVRALDRPLSAGPGTLRMTASAGLARVGRELSTPHALLAGAGVALEAAQQDGDSSCGFFTPELHADRLARAVLQAELAAGIRGGQLELDYQPLVDTTGRWRSAEALVRWRHPELGRLSPDRFIGLAEQSELIVALGEWVLEEACGQLAAWRSAGLVPDGFSVAVNVSGVQLNREDLIEHVRAALRASGLPPTSLTLEVTETAMMQVEAVLPRLQALRALGVSIAIDDFGTGHSSLAYLKDLPADVVKLPRAFVRDAHRAGPGAAIIAALVGLARPLGLRVVAEGVETPEQRACVAEAGCDLIQGYLFSPPMRPDQFAALAPSGVKPRGERGRGVTDDRADGAQRVGGSVEDAAAGSVL